MELKLSQKEQALLELLLVIPPELEQVQTALRAMSRESVTRIAITYAERCCMEDRTIPEEDEPGEVERIASGLNSTYIVAVMTQLLEAGADPNMVLETQFSRYNLMGSLVHIDNGYLAADALALALEHGGDPNLVIEEDNTLFDVVDFDVWFGAVEQFNRQRYAAWVHAWMVLLAYGGSFRGDNGGVCTFREYDSREGFDLKKLKEHRRFYIALSVEEGERVLHIYDKQSLWEVANTKSAWACD